ncbi:MAG TPA: archaeosine synthase subunit alpha [Candidatus Acidoferrales bacterium]|nr:archaeosine synthase subunit alpha [Candidatus Acidoferrales bacterium]
MKRQFEVIKRDGAARVGRLNLLDKTVTTPYMLQTKEELELIREQIGENGVLKVELIDDVEKIPQGIEADVVILGGAVLFEKDPRGLSKALTTTREALNADSALYTPALATPENVSLLVYAGVDVIDFMLAEVKATEGFFLYEDGEERFQDVLLPQCTCNACQQIGELKGLPFERRVEIASQHNKNALQAELYKIRARISRGTLRELVEGRCRASTTLTAFLRLLDENYDFFEKRTPIVRTSTMLACTQESMNRTEIIRFSERVITRLKQRHGILLLLPCSAKKPYSSSMSHKIILSSIWKFRRSINEAIISSPLGVIPRSLECVYPPSNYDVPVTGTWSCDETKTVSTRLLEYLKANSFDVILAHVSGPYKDVCNMAASLQETDIVYTTINEDLLSPASLKNLKEVLQGLIKEHRPPKRDLRFDYIRDTIDYQYGTGVSDYIFLDRPKIGGIYPTYHASSNGVRIATIIKPYGTATLTIPGATRYLKSFEGHYCVYIDDFVPKGTVFAVGVLSADPIIRPYDEVVVLNDKVISVGRALMSGWEMQSSTKGGAVVIRHVEER